MPTHNDDYGNRSVDAYQAAITHAEEQGGLEQVRKFIKKELADSEAIPQDSIDFLRDTHDLSYKSDILVHVEIIVTISS